MADLDLLPKRGIPALALVDGTGVASNGTSTITQLAARGMQAICAVDSTGNAVTGGTLAQLAARGLETFCPVDENGLAQDASTADTLRKRGIQPMVLLNASGVALTGSSSMTMLASRGLDYFCPLDEAGNATTMGAVVLLSNSTVPYSATIGANVGVLSVAGGTGTYTFTLLSNPGGLFVTAGTNGVNLNVAAALTAGTAPITVRAAGGVPTPVDRVFNIIVTPPAPPIILTAQTGVFPLTGEDMTPITGYQLSAGAGTFAVVDPGTTKLTPPATAALGLDGSGIESTTSGVTVANITITTTQPNTLICLSITANGGPITGVTSSPTQTWASLAASTPGGSTGIDLWYARAATPATYVISATQTGAAFIACNVFAVVGGKLTGSPFEGTVTSNASPSDPRSITTTSTNTMVLGLFRLGSPSTTAGSGMTLISCAGNFNISEYVLKTSSGTFSIPIFDAGASNAAIVTAVVKGP